MIRQERPIVPGLLLTRRLDSFYHCYALDMTSTKQGVLLDNRSGNCGTFGNQGREYKLREFVLF